MSTQGFEERFLHRLGKLLAARHPGLELEVPASGERLYGPQPDFLVRNPRTGARIAGEFRSGAQARHIPLVTLPQLRALRETLRMRHPSRTDVVLITTGHVPSLVVDGLNRDGIPILFAHSPDEAAERFGERLNSL